ncbi:hypothetical protein D3C81_1586490 [compost metagenome]
MRACGQRVRIEVRLAAQLDDALGQFAGMCLLLLRVFQELALDCVGQHALGHEVVPVVAQHAYIFGGQRVVEQLDHHLAVGAVAVGDRSVLDVLPCPLAQGLAIADASDLGGRGGVAGFGWLVGHGWPVSSAVRVSGGQVIQYVVG